MSRLIVAVDFDGTIVEDKFPYIGATIKNSFETMKKIKDKGGRLILWTCRNNEYLNQAVDYCERRGIKFDAICDNVTGLTFKPYPKIVATAYIDDRGNSLNNKSPEEMAQVWDNIYNELDTYDSDKEDTQVKGE